MAAMVAGLPVQVNPGRTEPMPLREVTAEALAQDAS